MFTLAIWLPRMLVGTLALGICQIRAESIDVAHFVATQMSIAEPGLQPSGERQFQYLKAPLVIPSFLKTAIKPPERWNDFFKIPNQGILFEPSSVTLGDAFSSLLSSLKFGNLQLTESQKDAVKNARALLFDPADSSIPSKSASSYQEKLKERDDWEAKTKSDTTSPAEKLLASQRVQELREELSAFPDGSRIQAAQDLLRRFSIQPSAGVADQVRERISSLSNQSWVGFLQEVASPGGWSRVSSSGKLQVNTPTASVPTVITEVQGTSSTGQVQNIAAPRLAAWQFSHKMVHMPWANFPAQLSDRKDWKLAGDRMVATGKIEPLTPKSSLIPQSCARLWVIRDISIWFDEDSARDVLDFLSKGGTVRLGTFAFSNGSTFFTPKSIHQSQPMIVAVETQAYPTLPQPNPDIQWTK